MCTKMLYNTDDAFQNLGLYVTLVYKSVLNFLYTEYYLTKLTNSFTSFQVFGKSIETIVIENKVMKHFA